MSRVDKVTFCTTYVPMATKGATALEIAEALGVDKPTDDEKSQFVSQKASNYRKELKTKALATAKKLELDEEATAALVKESVAKMPKLTTKAKVVDDFAAFLDGLLEAADGPAEEGEPPLLVDENGYAPTSFR